MWMMYDVYQVVERSLCRPTFRAVPPTRPRSLVHAAPADPSQASSHTCCQRCPHRRPQDSDRSSLLPLSNQQHLHRVDIRWVYMIFAGIGIITIIRHTWKWIPGIYVDYKYELRIGFIQIQLKLKIRILWLTQGLKWNNNIILFNNLH